MWGIQELGHDFRKVWNTWPGRILQGSPGPSGRLKISSCKMTAAAASKWGMGLESTGHPLRSLEVWAASGRHQHERSGVLVPLGWTREVRISDSSEHPSGIRSRVSFCFTDKLRHSRVAPGQQGLKMGPGVSFILVSAPPLQRRWTLSAGHPAGASKPPQIPERSASYTERSTFILILISETQT